MKKMLTVLLCLVSMYVFAQNRQVKGKVTDENGVGLPGASVFISGSKQGVQTDNTGNFTVSVPSDGKKHDLTISYIGYASKTVPSDGAQPLSISMVKESATTDEVVVLGYTSTRRKDLTASVSTITAKQLKDIPLNSAEEALAGRLAGVQVTGSEGSPDAQVIIRVRGGGSITQDNSPLYVVDGIQVDNALSTLSPQDIQSIDVLKDAAATSIYGARGANGVVIITTKGGRNTNGKTNITYNVFVGLNTLANELKVMDPYNFLYYQYERTTQTGDSSGIAPYGYSWDTVNKYKTVPFYDWQKRVLGRNAFSQTHNLSISGGTDKTQYYLSVTEAQQDGVMLNSDYDRKLVSFRFDHNATDRLKVGFNIRYNNTIIDGAGTSNPGSSSLEFLRQVVRYRPFLLPGQADVAYDPNYALATNGNSLSLVNPVLLNNAQYRRNYTNVLDFSGYANYNFSKTISFRSTFGWDYNWQRQNSFDDTLTQNSKSNGAALPIASINSLSKSTINNSNVLTYSNAGSTGRFKERNDIKFLVGEETYETYERDYYIETRYFPLGITATSALANMNLGTPPAGSTEPKPTSFEAPTSQLSFFSNLVYSYDKKYFFTASVRADGSSLFGPANRWGYFPSASAAWRISRENFMQNVHFISDLKLRGSYGTAGNNRITPYLFLTQFNSNGQYGLNGVVTSGYLPAALTNANLKWETTTSRSIGIDAGLFHDRIQLSFDYYNNTTADLLVNVPVPSFTGYTSQLQNVGSTRNEGVELQLGALVMQKKSFSWNASFNISFNKNTIISLGPNQTSYQQNSGWAGASNPADFIVKVGQPVGAMYGLVNDGFYTTNDFDYNPATRTYTKKATSPDASGVTSVIPQPGGIKFKDLNGDGKISLDSDRTIIGNAQPKFFGGLNQQFTFGNFDMSVFINFQYGNKVYNYNKLEFTSGYTPGANLLAIMQNRWKTIDANGVVYQQVKNGAIIGATPDSLNALNKNAGIWMPLVGASGSSFSPQSSVVEDGSFIRINNISFGYSLPASLLSKMHISRLRFYATLNNVAVITGYSGYDPEVNTRRGTPVTPGVDYSAYPRSHSYIFGLNLTF